MCLLYTTPFFLNTMYFSYPVGAKNKNTDSSNVYGYLGMCEQEDKIEKSGFYKLREHIPGM